MLGQGVEVVAGLSVGFGQVAAGAFLFNQEDTEPEQVNVAGRVVEAFDVLLIAGDGAPLDTEDVKEVVIEALRLAFLVGCVLSLFGKCGGAGSDFIPGETHAVRIRPATFLLSTA